MALVLMRSSAAPLGHCPMFIRRPWPIGDSPGFRGCAACSRRWPPASAYSLLVRPANSSIPNVAIRPLKGAGPRRRGCAEIARVGDKQQVVDAARRVKRSVVSLAHNGCLVGTGFVISRAHRLVVTAGHVADAFFEARAHRSTSHSPATKGCMRSSRGGPSRSGQRGFGTTRGSSACWAMGLSQLARPERRPHRIPRPGPGINSALPGSGDLPPDCEAKSK